MTNQPYFHTVLEKVSYHVVYDPNLHDALDFAAAHGFKGIQIALEIPRFAPQRFSENQRQALRQHAEKLGLQIGLHGPQDVASLYATHPALVRGIRDYYTDVFHFAAALGASLLTIHLGTIAGISAAVDANPEHLPYEDRAFYEAQLSQNLAWLAQKCPANLTICIENYQFADFVLKILTEFLKTPRFSLSWDIAKTYQHDLSKNIQVEQFFLDHLASVRQCHLHDVAPGFHAHQVIGSGVLNFVEFLIQLQRAPIQDYCIEVRPREQAVISLRNLKQILTRFDDQMQLWTNITSSDPDPAILELNHQQSRLEQQGLLSQPVLQLRRQMRYLEPTHYRFFENLAEIIGGIGKKAPAQQLYYCLMLDPQRQAEIQEYLQCLDEWLHPLDSQARQLATFIKLNALLGAPSPTKILLVGRLKIHLEFILRRTPLGPAHEKHEPPTDRFAPYQDLEIPSVLAQQQQILNTVRHGREFEQHLLENYLCHHKFFRHLEIILENTGQEKWNFQRRTRGRDGVIRAAQMEAYFKLLRSWLQAEPEEIKAELQPLLAQLGAQDAVKQWLVATLMKLLENFIQSMRYILPHE